MAIGAHAVYQGVTNTARSLETLARVASVVKGVHKAVSTGVSAFIRTGAAGALKGAIEKEASMHALPAGRRDAMRGEDDFAKRSAEIGNLASNPQLLMNSMGRSTSRLQEAAPHITLQMNTAAAASVKYLDTIRPKNPNTPGMIQPSEDWEAPRSEVAAYRPIHAVVDNPMLALDHMSNGTLTPQMCQALKATVPEFHQFVCEEFERQLLEHPKSAAKLDYQSRLQLSMFLDKPIDSSTSPQFAMTMLAPPSAPPQAPQQKTARPSQAGLKNLNFSAASATHSQSLEQKERAP
jgi:hypothetical protein